MANSRVRSLFLACLAGALVPAHAAVFSVAEPWVRPAAKGAATEAFMELRSSDATTLVEVRSPYAKQVKLVSPATRQAPPFALELPAREKVLLAPSGTRVALERLDRALELRDHVPLVLVLRHPDGALQEIEVRAEVRRRSPSDDHRRAHRQ